jgi:hypothetical protein
MDGTCHHNELDQRTTVISQLRTFYMYDTPHNELLCCNGLLYCLAVMYVRQSDFQPCNFVPGEADQPARLAKMV